MDGTQPSEIQLRDFQFVFSRTVIVTFTVDINEACAVTYQPFWSH